MSSSETRFLADSMLGRLAKWLRVIGCDTHYQPFYKEGVIARLMQDRRIFLSCSRTVIEQYPNSLHIKSNKLKGQLQEIRDIGYISNDRSKWFGRCLNCNISLKQVSVEDARENIPEHVFYQNIAGIHFCPSCTRYFWPGSHRHNMIKQLEEWGFESP